MTDPILGYRRIDKDTWRPIVQPRGGIYTAAFILCGKCNGVISGHGGPGGQNTLCPKCFDNLNLMNFVENGVAQCQNGSL